MEIATVGDWARRRAAEAPDAPALISADGGVLTYGALAATLDGAARDLAATGLRRGSTAALLCDSRAAGVVAAFAISEVATVAPLNPAAPEAELRDTLRRIEVDALAFPAGMSSAVALAEAEGLATLPFETPPDAPPGLVSFGAAADAPQPPRPDPDDLAFIVLTSGSTVAPRRRRCPTAPCWRVRRAISRFREPIPTTWARSSRPSTSRPAGTITRPPLRRGRR